MEEQIYNLGQKVYLVLNGVYNDVAGAERTAFIDETIDWTNQYLDELALEADWSWIRENDSVLGTITNDDDTIPLDPTTLRMVYDWKRAITMTKTDGQKTTWSLVKPNLLYNPAEGGVQQNRVAVVGRTLRFSRPFANSELGAVLTGDVIKRFPEVSRTNITAIEQVEPLQLLVLGIAKNQVLPDVVNNVLTSNYDVKYQRVLKRAIDLDGASTEQGELDSEDFSFIGGVY